MNNMIKYKIHGMTCQRCVAAAEQAISNIPEVAQVKVTLPDQAEVTWISEPVGESISKLSKALESHGYSITLAPANAARTLVDQSLSDGSAKFPKLNVFQASAAPEKTGQTTAVQINQTHVTSPEMITSESLVTKLKNVSPENERPGSQTWELNIQGMHCASCVNRVETALKSSPGVKNASVNLATERATVEVDPDQAQLDKLRIRLRDSGYDLVKRESGLSIQEEADALRRERNERVYQWKWRLLLGVILGLPLIMIAHGANHESGNHPGISLRVALVALSYIITFIVGLPYFQVALRLIRKGSTNMDTLVALGASVAFLYGTWMTLIAPIPEPHFLADGVIILVMVTFGKWLEARSRGSAADALESLMDLSPKRVTAVRESGREIVIDQADIRVGMLFRVKPGEAIATDGLVVEGDSAVDEAMLTGESMPVRKSPKSLVIGGTRAIDGSLLIRATKVGSDTVLHQIIESVKKAQSSKALVQKRVDQIASVFVPSVICIAITTVIVWGLIMKDWSGGIFASAAVLLISCPCALGLATPMAIAVASTRAARTGLIIRDAGVFERCNQLKVCMFDKTGTLTSGSPKVLETWTAEHFAEKDVLRYASAVESRSEHPLARSIVEAGVNIREAFEISEFQSVSGSGVSAVVNGSEINVGSLAWIRSQNIRVQSEAETIISEWSKLPRSIIAVTKDQELAGLFAIGDHLRDSAKSAVDLLIKMNLKVGIISGDRKPVVEIMAKELGIDLAFCFAEVLPEMKSDIIKRMSSEHNKVAMVGDGLNDAPALALADVSMALSTGTDVAKNAADIVIVGSDLNLVAESIALSQATLKTIHHNLFWAFAYNVIAIPLAAVGFFAENGPIIASIAMGLSSVTVVLRSALLATVRLNR